MSTPMNLNLEKTQVEQSLLSAFDRLAPDLPGAAWLGEARRLGLAAFENYGLPHRRVEEYKYFDLRQMLAKAGPLVPAPDSREPVMFTDDAARVFTALDRYVVVFVNGRYRADLSRIGGLPEGVTLTSFAEAANARAPWLEAAMKTRDGIGDPVAALNFAFAADGAALHVEAGVKLDKPVELVWYSTGEPDTFYHARSVIVLEEGAEATVLETRSDGMSAPLLATMGVTVHVGRNARLRHASVFADAAETIRLRQNTARIAENGEYKALCLAVGRGKARTCKRISLAGEGAFAGINALSLHGGDAVMDNTLYVDHAAPNTESEETFRTVLDDKARGVFQGAILVREGAQKAAAEMQSRALLLSRRAEMDVKPMLEIYADDVVCAHGSAIGEPDADALFYLMSRGIDEKTARALLIAGFLDDVVDRFDDGALAAALKTVLSARLGAPSESEGA